MPEPFERGLSRTQSAAKLGVSVATLRRLEKRGEIPPARVVSPGRCVHLNSELDAYLRRCRTEPLQGRTRRALEARAETDDTAA